MNDKSPGKTKEDKELFELWENKIRIEVYRDIASNKIPLWSMFHFLGHKTVAWFIKNKCKIAPNDKIFEPGCGICYFPQFLDKSLQKHYIGLDISKKVLDVGGSDIKKIQGDIYRLPLADGAIKYIVSVYNFEHLHRLDEALLEIIRVMDNDGALIFAIPMEDGFLYNLGRNLTSRRLVERRYGVDYMKIIREYEHPNTALKVINEIRERFTITDRLYLPFLIPSININLLAVYKAIKK